MVSRVDDVAPDVLEVGVADDGDGLPQRVSASQVATFQSCPLRYYFSTVLGWREPPTRASTAGELVHDALEQLYRLDPVERTDDRAHDLLRDRARARFEHAEYATFRDDRDVAERAFRALRNALTIEYPATVDVAPDGVEAEVSAVLEGVSFGGRIDRVTRGAAVPRITDYKTGVKPQPAYLESKLRQLYLYAAAELASGGVVAEVELLYLGGRQGERVRRPVFAAVVSDAADELARMRRGSESALMNRTFPARKSGLCRFCKFRRVCPQFVVNAPAPGSDESNDRLAGTDVTRRRRPQPEPLESMPDTDAEVE